MKKKPFKSIIDDPDYVAPPKRKFGTGRHALSGAQYNMIKDFILTRDPNGSGKFSRTKCAEAANVAVGTVRKAYEHGWPRRNPPLPAIKDVLEEQMLRARSERVREQLLAVEETKMKEQRNATNDAIRTRKQEGLMVQATRSLAGKLLHQAVRMAQGVELLTHDIVNQIKTEYAGVDDFGDHKKSVRDKLTVVREVQQIARDSANLAETAMILERKFMGEPEKILGVEGMGIEEAVAELYAGAQAIHRIRMGKVINVTPSEDGDDSALASMLPTILDQIDDPSAVLEAAGIPLAEGDE